MPILWRYLLKGYLRIFFLSVSTFISILLVSRFKEIARFAALSSESGKTFLFVLYQIPLILPLALPISALIASFLLFQRLSRTFEFTAFRAARQSILSLLTPLLLASLLFSLLNFFICSEISPFCRRETKTLLYRETSSNPLLLLQRQHLVEIKNTYLRMQMDPEGKAAKDLLLIAYNKNNQRLNLFSARQLEVVEEHLLGRDVAILSHLPAEKEEEFDTLILENQTSMSTAAPILSTALKKKRPELDASALNLRMLRLRLQEELAATPHLISEIVRRLYLSLAVFSLTLLGAIFGLEPARNTSKKGVMMALGFTLTILLGYLIGKELKNHLLLAFAFLLLPHPLAWMASGLRYRNITRGCW